MVLGKGVVIGLAGRIGSGKTTVSTALADALLCHRTGFGDYVRIMAARQGLHEPTRHDLQRIGEALIERDCVQFCRDVLQAAHWVPGNSLVLDGIRHVQVCEALRAIIAPSPFVLVYVQTDDDIRLNRLAERAGGDTDQQLEKHSTERQVKTLLPIRADLLIDGNKPADDLIAEIKAWLQA